MEKIHNELLRWGGSAQKLVYTVMRLDKGCQLCTAGKWAEHLKKHGVPRLLPQIRRGTTSGLRTGRGAGTRVRIPHHLRALQAPVSQNQNYT